MFGQILAFIRFLLVVLFSFLAITIGSVHVMLNKKNSDLPYWYIRFWARTNLWLMGVKVELIGETINTGCIVMPNHRSYIDIMVVMGLAPSSIVAKKEVGSWPVLGMAVKCFKIILVDRKSSKSMIQTMRSIKAHYDVGGRVIIFPEGTTHIGPLTKNFKPGSFKIASEGKIPVVPVAIDYKDDNDAWIGKDKLIPHWQRQLSKLKTPVKVKIGYPVSNDDHMELLKETKQWIDDGLTDIRKQWGKLESN